MIKIGILSLGCPRNLVDSEVMLGLLKKRGYIVSQDAEDADIVIVNTCGFIEEAKEESIEAILQFAQVKKEGRLKALIVAGCLPQRYKEDLVDGLPEVDAFIGTDVSLIEDAIKRVTSGERNFSRIGKPNFLYTHRSPRILLTPKHYAYVKISEGCPNRCSFCAIPKMRGKFRSRDFDSVIQEVNRLQDRGGVKEINIIGQDITFYGKDIYGKFRLAELLEELNKILKEIKWIRLIYTHPAHITNDLIKTIKDTPSICKYIDLPIQHINDRILKKMRRGISKSQILSLIERLRENIPDLTIRTSIIVGFPGETEREFEELLGFIREVKFERLGAFIYSKEDGTDAYNFSGQVPDKIKKRRFDRVMSLQQEISKEHNEQLLGREIEVLIDEVDEEDAHLFIARTQADAPEVDGQVFVRPVRNTKFSQENKISNGLKTKRARPGEFLRVKIVDTYEYDLVGEEICPRFDLGRDSISAKEKR